MEVRQSWCSLWAVASSSSGGVTKACSSIAPLRTARRGGGAPDRIGSVHGTVHQRAHQAVHRAARHPSGCCGRQRGPQKNAVGFRSSATWSGAAARDEINCSSSSLRRVALLEAPRLLAPLPEARSPDEPSSRFRQSIYWSSFSPSSIGRGLTGSHASRPPYRLQQRPSSPLASMISLLQ
jgi:hypothetical protein